MKLHDAISDREGSGLEQRKVYFEGIGANVPSGLGKQIEMAFAWFVLRIYLSHPLIIGLIVIGTWTKT